MGLPRKKKLHLLIKLTSDFHNNQRNRSSYMDNVVIKQGAVPPQRARPRKSKYAFMHSVNFGEYAIMGKLGKTQYRTLAGQVYKFNRENGKQLGMRTTDNGVVVYRKS